MKIIYTICCKEIQVSDEDYLHLVFANWQMNRSEGYPVATTIYKGEYLHIVVAKRMGLNATFDIDHKDQNKLNCQRENLREATRSQNKQNGKAYNGRKYKGVYFDKRSNKWEASVKVNKKNLYLGRFDSPEKAAIAYNNAAIKYYGEFAALNTIESSKEDGATIKSNDS